MILDVRRILADEVIGKFIDGGRHRVGPSLDDRLAPARDPGVGLHLEETPAGRHDERREFRDFHGFDREYASVR